jgi:uncharacterized membrane protein
MLGLIFYSPVVVSLLLTIVYFLWRKKYQWPLGRFFRYIFYGGVIGFMVAFVFVVTWTVTHDAPQGPLGIFYFGPSLFALGELVGFALFLWVNSRKRDDEKKK